MWNLNNSSMTARSEHVVDNLDAAVSMADTNVQNSIEGRKLSYFLCGMGSPIDDRRRGDHDWQEYYFYRLQDGFSHLGTVISMDPNEGIFVLHSEIAEKGEDKACLCC